MAITTYAELQTAVLNWLNRTGDTDAASRVVEWIALAENELRIQAKRLELRQGETKDTAFSISSEFTALPTGFYRARHLFITSVSPPQPLEYIPPHVAERWGNVNSAGDLPTNWTIQGNQLRVFATPSTTYTATFTYFALPALSVSNTTNWLLTAHPKVYLSATMAEAYEYYESVDKAAAKRMDIERLLNSLVAADGVDQQGTALQMRSDTGNP